MWDVNNVRIALFETRIIPWFPRIKLCEMVNYGCFEIIK